MADEKDPKTASEKDNRGISASKEVDPNAKPTPAAESKSAAEISGTPKDESENPKILAPAGTVPTAAAAPGPSLPHPSVDFGKDLNPTKPVAEAQVRALEGLDESDTEVTGPKNIGEVKGDPIQCIARKKFFDARGATIKAGATYYYQPRINPATGELFPFPIEVLEPVNKTVAQRARKDQRERLAKAQEDRAARLKRREAFDRMAAELE